VFSGIIEAIGTVRRLERTGDDAVLEIEGAFEPPELRLGESIATAGVCLTVREVTPTGFLADLSEETLKRTTLGSLRPGMRVNLERSLRVGDRIGGHFVFGHVDAVGEIRVLDKDAGLRLVVAIPPSFRSFVVDKGSVAVDGISLTMCDCSDEAFAVALIPHTLEATSLASGRAGDRVNLEADMLARYARRAVETDPSRARHG
jgi:riboflavin synthase